MQVIFLLITLKLLEYLHFPAITSSFLTLDQYSVVFPARILAHLHFLPTLAQLHLIFAHFSSSSPSICKIGMTRSIPASWSPLYHSYTGPAGIQLFSIQ